MINEQLKKYRKLNNKTQKQISELLNMSKTGYASIEQGLAEPNIHIIKTLCIYYDISSDELLEIDTDKQKQTFINSFNGNFKNTNIKF